MHFRVAGQSEAEQVVLDLFQRDTRLKGVADIMRVPIRDAWHDGFPAQVYEYGPWSLVCQYLLIATHRLDDSLADCQRPGEGLFRFDGDDVAVIKNDFGWIGLGCRFFR